MTDDRTVAGIKAALAAQVQEAAARYPTSRSAIMPALELAQQKYGSVDGTTYQAVAELLDVPEIWVFEVASFYTLFDRAEPGRHHLRLCTNVSCMLRGAEEILDCLQEQLSVKDGETTADGLITLSGVECLGACDKAPVLMVDDEYHEDVTAETLDALLKALTREAKEGTA
ncbi:NADH-quinone oxidoreductase subunit NuoE family protein [Leisingera sp. McT4-56]|uniref:NADH-quinone oxidoreductase subunit NuoE family protein n=1 Tax=Leisingera sp. McT4-56 TaxID=2881255 RepID=UPI001CF8D572|nr:NAD(P)H-dependent oxidoreductase subunit E [Leisingera sp. McT4-56]MCB4455660.1 NAD(P)H-dependent oxidoreductase subunit E [Leisingera sp. McT4-56]